MLEIKEDFNEGPLLAIFTTRPGLRLNDTYWEWEQSTQGLNRVFFRDTESMWFVKHIDKIVEYLSDKRPKICMGISRGGYAAILIAHLIGSKAVAFSPQTQLSDGRWPEIKRANKIAKYPDLSNISGDHHIFYCERNKLDKKHAERMNVNLHPINCDNHLVTQSIDYEKINRNFLDSV